MNFSRNQQLAIIGGTSGCLLVVTFVLVMYVQTFNNTNKKK